MYLDYVNAYVGTANHPRFSHGNVLPIVSVPHGMASFTIQTDGGAGNFFYHPSHRSFEGIRLTHQPSPWVGDYGHLLIMPQSGAPKKTPAAWWSSFEPQKIELHPHFCEGTLKRDGIAFSFAPVNSGAAFCFLFRESRGNRVAFAPVDGKAKWIWNTEENTLSGFLDTCSDLQKNLVREYLFVRFRTPIRFSEEEDVLFAESDGQKIEFCLATSFVSEEQAAYNEWRELGDRTLSKIRTEAAALWEDVLSRIEVSGENTERRKMFYSCLYRSFLFPRRFYEIDAAGRKIHRHRVTGEIVEGVYYTDNGFWDTYRTVYPLYALIAPENYKEMVEGFLNFYDETGYLPRWLSPDEIGIMPGTLVEAVLADAVIKRIVDRRTSERILHAVRKNAEVPSGNSLQGRKCVKEYILQGYVPNDLCRESVSETLDYCYGDFCIAQIADVLGEKKVADKYRRRAGNYRNLFDPKSGLMRGKNSQGIRTEEFDSYEWGGEYTEGSAWQASFAVYHDVEGLAECYGGRDKMIAKLNELFATPPIFHIGNYGREIHEMSEMAAVDFGQCAISNQPSFHIPYLYTLLGARENAESWIEKLVSEAFFCTPEGFPGDEDNGAMSSWYLFSCMGFYPVCPGKDEYVCTKPLFERIVLHTLEGKSLIKRFEKPTVTRAEILSSSN